MVLFVCVYRNDGYIWKHLSLESASQIFFLVISLKFRFGLAGWQVVMKKLFRRGEKCPRVRTRWMMILNEWHHTRPSRIPSRIHEFHDGIWKLMLLLLLPDPMHKRSIVHILDFWSSNWNIVLILLLSSERWFIFFILLQKCFSKSFCSWLALSLVDLLPCWLSP